MSEIPAGINRRRLLGTGLATAVLATVGGQGVASAAEPRGRSGPSAQSRGLAFLDASMDGYPAFGPIRLAQSYADQANLFSTAFTYDNALTILAYLAQRGEDAQRRAVVLGDALLYAQAHDPQHNDGRLRQGYNVGPYTFFDGVPQPHGFVRPDGTANVGSQFGFVGTAVGDMAWAAIALVSLHRRTGSGRFLAGAVRIGEWIETNARTNTDPLGGYKFGVDGGNAKLPFTSTEHNIDLTGLFGQLAIYTGDSVWRSRRDHAKAFVKKMWEPAGGFFYTGSNDGTDINKALIPEDTQTWSYLALQSSAYEGSLDWEAAELRVVDNSTRTNSTVPAGQTYEGVTFSSASLVANESAPIAPFQPNPNRQGVWFEGSAHLALALKVRGKRCDEALVAKLISSTEQAQDKLGAGQTIGGKALPERSGVVSATSPLDTGFGFGYYPYRHTGATAWYLMAALKHNPLSAPAR